MINLLKESIWKQFGASIDMLENAITNCPIESWNTEKKFWYNAFHCLFFLDYYLTLEPKKFSPPAPFTLSEFENEMPDRVYSHEELLTYLNFCKQKCHDLISGLTEEIAASHWVNQSGSMDFPLVELLIYNMRHVQHHAAQLNLILRQDIDIAPRWVSRAKIKL